MLKPQPDAAAPRSWQRRLLVFVGVVVVLHSVVLALWLSPSNPLRDAVGDERLASYVDPYFQQSSSALDPGAQYVDETFRLRAHIKDDDTGKDRVTEWVDLTAAEDEAVRHDPDPARVHVIARRLATNLNGAMFALDAKQRSLVTVNYITTPISKLGARLSNAGASPDAVQTYLTYDRMAVQFASLYADARWDGDILEVQYLVGYRTVPAYADRSTTQLRDLPFNPFAFGYRRAYSGTFEAQTAFDSYVKN